MSTALNLIDWVRPAYNILIEAYPAILGSDIAGEVEAVGEGITDFAKGDRVIAELHGGGFGQYTAIPAAIAIRLPDNINFEDGSTLPVAFTTACVALFAPKPLGIRLNPTFLWDKPQKGKSALVIGANACVGQYTIQLLKFLGFGRIIAYASASNSALLESLGATHCVDRSVVSLAELPSSPAVGAGVDVALDIFGVVDEAYDCVLDGGKLVTVSLGIPLTRKGKAIEFQQAVGYYYGPDVLGMSVEAKGYSALPAHTDFGHFMKKNLPVMLEKKVIIPSIVEVLPGGLKGISGGLQRL